LLRLRQLERIVGAVRDARTVGGVAAEDAARILVWVSVSIPQPVGRPERGCEAYTVYRLTRRLHLTAASCLFWKGSSNSMLTRFGKRGAHRGR
jgi:hypothetical protein